MPDEIYMKNIRQAAMNTISKINNIDSTPDTIHSELDAKTFITPQRRETTKIDILQLKNSSISDIGVFEIR